MSMSESLSAWLKKRDICFKPDEATLLCRDRLMQQGESLDACVNLAYSYENEVISPDEFMVNLGRLTGFDYNKLNKLIAGVDDGEEEVGENKPEGTHDNAEVGEFLPEHKHPSGEMEPS